MPQSTIKDPRHESRLFNTRAVIAGVLVVLALLLLLLRLGQLQIVNFDHFSTLSQDNRVKLEPLPPTRGLVYDAGGCCWRRICPPTPWRSSPRRPGISTRPSSGWPP